MNVVEPLIEGRDEDVVRLISSALPELFGYLLHRCGSRAVAEDLASESVLAAIDRLRAGAVRELSVAYLVGIARHKLVDHWRREEREQRHLRSYSGDVSEEAVIDAFEPGGADRAMQRIAPMQRAALTLRYVDDLPIPSVAAALALSLTATEKLLTRAKRAFQHQYAEVQGADHD